MDIHQRSFFYSHEEHLEKNRLAGLLNQIYVPGLVMVNGQMRSYTTITNKNTCKYNDAKLITEGRIDKIHHIPERFE